jgi:hypothetical protein
MPNGRKISQHFPLLAPPKYTQIGIFGLKINHLATLSSGMPLAFTVAPAQRKIRRHSDGNFGTANSFSKPDRGFRGRFLIYFIEVEFCSKLELS